MNWYYKIIQSQIQSIPATIMSMIHGQIGAKQAYELLSNTNNLPECCNELNAILNSGIRIQNRRPVVQLQRLLKCYSVENPGNQEAPFFNPPGIQNENKEMDMSNEKESS